MLVCCTRGSRFEYTFFAKIFFKFYRFCRFYRIQFGKTLLVNGLCGIKWDCSHCDGNSNGITIYFFLAVAIAVTNGSTTHLPMISVTTVCRCHWRQSQYEQNVLFDSTQRIHEGNKILVFRCHCHHSMNGPMLTLKVYSHRVISSHSPWRWRAAPLICLARSKAPPVNITMNET